MDGLRTRSIPSEDQVTRERQLNVVQEEVDLRGFDDELGMSVLLIGGTSEGYYSASVPFSRSGRHARGSSCAVNVVFFREGAVEVDDPGDSRPAPDVDTPAYYVGRYQFTIRTSAKTFKIGDSFRLIHVASDPKYIATTLAKTIGDHLHANLGVAEDKHPTRTVGEDLFQSVEALVFGRVYGYLLDCGG